MPINSRIGISVRTWRARPASRISRPIKPVFARLTRASVSPVMKCTTLSCSRLVYWQPHRKMGRFRMGKAFDADAKCGTYPRITDPVDNDRCSGGLRAPLPTKAVLAFYDPHQYTPTVVVGANCRNGRTPLTPSQGYFS